METFDFIIYVLYALCGLSLLIFAKMTWSLLHIDDKEDKKPVETDSKKDEPKDNCTKGLRLFDIPGKTLEAEKLTIAQAAPGDCNGGALVILTTHDGDTEFNLTALYQNTEGKDFYDRRAFRIRENKEIRQTGVFTYHCKGGYMATVPVVDIFEKNEGNS